jgi:hypothetical protein
MALKLVTDNDASWQPPDGVPPLGFAMACEVCDEMDAVLQTIFSSEKHNPSLRKNALWERIKEDVQGTRAEMEPIYEALGRGIPF